MAASMGQYAKDQTGFLANFFYNPLAYARLDSRLEDSELWMNADRKPGRDPMGLDPARQVSPLIILYREISDDASMGLSKHTESSRDMTVTAVSHAIYHPMISS